MASLKVPELVPSPAEDAEQLRKAFQGSLSVSTSNQSFCYLLILTLLLECHFLRFVLIVSDRFDHTYV